MSTPIWVDPPYDGNLAGTLDAYSFDNSNPAVRRICIPDTDQVGFQVALHLTQFATLQATPYQWQITVFLEDVSLADKDCQLPIPANAPKIVDATAPTSTGPGYWEFVVSIVGKQGDVPDGVYKPTVYMQLYNDPDPNGAGAPYPATASLELPVLTIYKPH